MLQLLRLLRLGAHGVSPVQGLDGERSARALRRRRLAEPKQLGQPKVMRMQVRELREPRLVGQRAESGATSATRASVRARARLERHILATDGEPDERVQRRAAQLK